MELIYFCLVAKKKKDIVLQEHEEVRSLVPRSIAVNEIENAIDRIMLNGLSKMESIMNSEEVFTYFPEEGKPILRIVETRDRITAFNAIINAAKYIEMRKKNESERPVQLNLSGFSLIDGEASQRIGLHPSV